jgi:hypothetical protein
MNWIMWVKSFAVTVPLAFMLCWYSDISRRTWR